MDIVVENITKRYGFQKALDNVSFTVKTGEVLGFLGPNGAGKTTTMKAITCFIAPNSGDIKVGGVSVRENPEKIKEHIGYMPENNPLYDEMPVIEYLKFVARLYGIRKNEMTAKILYMVTLCGLEGEKHKKIGELSRGYKQRVGLAQALIHDPEVLILDEPTSGLDPNQIAEIRQLIKKIGKEKTVLLSSHILAEVEATCDRILIIDKGQIIADGTAQQLRSRAQGTEIIKATIEGGDVNKIKESIRILPHVTSVIGAENQESAVEIQTGDGKVAKREIFDICVKNKWYLTELTTLETKLEDIFRELTYHKNE